MSREQDIQELIKQVLDISPEYTENHNIGDYWECPFCEEISCSYLRTNCEMNDIKHDQNCAYLIAKDLNTK